MSSATPFERLEEIAKEQKRTVRGLVELTGRNPSIVSALRTGKKEVSTELAQAIADFFGYSFNWIVWGEGEKLDSHPKQIVFPAGHVPSTLRQIPGRATRKPIKIAVNSELIPILKTPLYARTGTGYTAYPNRQPEDKEWEYIHPSKLYPGVKPEDHTVVTINGDSMEPMLQAGWEVLAYVKPEGQFPRLNKIVMLDFKDELIIKRLVNVDWVDHTVTVQSDNGGAQMRIPMGDIRAVYHVYDYNRAQL